MDGKSKVTPLQPFRCNASSTLRLWNQSNLIGRGGLTLLAVLGICACEFLVVSIRPGGLLAEHRLSSLSAETGAFKITTHQLP